MRFLKEDYLLEQEINNRKPMANGKIKVSSKEWDMLWDKYLGSTNKEVKSKCSDIHKWFDKVRQFGDKYECEN